MATSTVAAVAASAAALLNDQAQSLFTTQLLLPYINHAYHDLLFAIDMVQVPIGKEMTNVALVVPAGNTVLTVPPADMIQPIKLEERSAGSSENFIPMHEMPWETNITPIDRMQFWAWRQDVIHFPGATTNREIRIYYWKDLDTTLDADDNILISRSDDFLAHKAAEYAAKYVMQDEDRAEQLKSDAKETLEAFIKSLVRKRQALPARRRPYGDRWRRLVRYW